MAKFGIIGAGAWGLAVAMKAIEGKQDVSVWGHSEDTVRRINNEHRSKRLDNIILPTRVHATSDCQQLCDASDRIVVGVASQHLKEVVQSIKLKTQPIILLSKGLLFGEERPFISEYVRRLFPENPVMVLSGPNIAIEIAQSKPAASVIAGEDLALCELIQTELSSETFRLYSTHDVMGVECGGIFKNVIAIAAGLCDGLECGDNAKSALVTRGLGEMQRVTTFFGGQSDTLSGLSGIGDMMTTCLSKQSRNRSFGELLGIGNKTDIQVFSHEKTVEGVRTVNLLAEKYPDLLSKCPIMRTVHLVIHERLSPHDAIRSLMTRDLISEND